MFINCQRNKHVHCKHTHSHIHTHSLQPLQTWQISLKSSLKGQKVTLGMQSTNTCMNLKNTRFSHHTNKRPLMATPKNQVHIFNLYRDNENSGVLLQKLWGYKILGVDHIAAAHWWKPSTSKSTPPRGNSSFSLFSFSSNCDEPMERVGQCAFSTHGQLLTLRRAI